MVGSCVLLYSRLSLRFSLMRSRMAWLIEDLGSLRLYTSGVEGKLCERVCGIYVFAEDRNILKSFLIG